MERWKGQQEFAWGAWGVTLLANETDAQMQPLDDDGKRREFARLETEIRAADLRHEDKRACISGLVVCFDESSFVLRMGHSGGPAYNQEVPAAVVWDNVAELMAQPGTVKICFDMKTNLHLLRASGVENVQGPLEDPRIAHWVLQSDEKRFLSVDHLHSHYTKQGKKSAKPQASQAPKGHDEPERAELAQNAAECCEQTKKAYEVMASLRPQLSSRELHSVFTELEMPLVPVLSGMEWNGIGFNKRYCEEAVQQARDKVDWLQREAELLFTNLLSAHIPDLSSPAKCSESLFEHLQADTSCSREGKNGRYSCNADVLAAVAQKNAGRNRSLAQFVRLLQEHRSLSAFLDKNGLSLSRCAQWSSECSMHRIHATVLQIHASTGRLAMTSPNLQNVHKSITFAPVSEN